MRDYGHEETDKLLEQMERKIAKEYKQASVEAQAKLDDYFRRFEIKDEKWRQMVANGEKTAQEYNQWRTGQIMIGKRWEDLKDTLAEDYHNANVIARSTIDGYMPEVYALNHNYATFQVEKGTGLDTSYTLYDKQTVERIMRDEPDLLPPPGKRMIGRIAAGKDIAWQEGQIQSVTLQSILQGESIPNMAKRIAFTMGESNHKDSIRYARTATTGAENAGRLDGYKRADAMGIQMRQTWVATLDNRTRHEHRMLDGQTVDIDEPFTVDGYEIRFPGDPQAEGFLIWNCRCTTIAQIKGFERDVTDLGLRRDEKLEGMTYEEWKEAKAVSQPITHQEEVSEAMKWTTINELYRGENAVDRAGEDGIIGASPKGSRQAREKAEAIEALGDVVPLVEEDPNVVSWVKPIAGEHSRKQDIDATNPNFATGEWGYLNNCQRCVTTYEARRRGFDVTALPANQIADPLGRGFSYKNPYDSGDRKVTTLWHEDGLKITEARNYTSEQCREAINRLMNEYGNGSRAIIGGGWLSNSDSHVFIAENVGGKVQFFDPQNGKMNCDYYIDAMGPASMTIFRIDDLKFTSEIKKVFKNDVI